ncbi:MAG: phosphoglucosamine mutase [Thermodesulfovibrionales bacterium]
MRLFGTDGIRGKVNTAPMTPETVLRVGLATARTLRKRHGRNMVLIGKDTRLSGYVIESALTSGICSMGMNVTLVGPMPTPGVAFLTRALRLDAGIVISASHNPFDDNGIKIFSSDGFKLPDRTEEKIEKLALDDGILSRRPTGAGIGRAFRLEDATGRYIEYIKSTVPKGVTLEGLKVVVDCANGAAYKVTPHVLSELGAEVVTINEKPDGTNINHGCGSLHLESLAEAVRLHGADAGVAHDGDADRALFVDEKGGVVDGDKVMGMWAVQMHKEGRLRGGAVVATVMSNLGLEHYLQSHGIKLLRTRVGDRYVTERMTRGGFNLGGEQSGHIVFSDYNTTGDGPITALHVLYLMKMKARPLSALSGKIALYPQILINVPLSKRAAAVPEAVKEAAAEAERRLDGKGRVLVRLSGTEPKVRVMLEGRDMGLIKRLGNNVARVIKKHMA